MKHKLNTLIDNSIFSINITKLDKYDLANLFNVVNKGENSYFNLCKNIYFNDVDNMSLNDVMNYTILEGDNWANISYKYYNTYKLWWLICKFNNIKNPFDELIARKNN